MDFSCLGMVIFRPVKKYGAVSTIVAAHTKRHILNLHSNN